MLKKLYNAIYAFLNELAYIKYIRFYVFFKCVHKHHLSEILLLSNLAGTTIGAYRFERLLSMDYCTISIDMPLDEDYFIACNTKGIISVAKCNLISMNFYDFGTQLSNYYFFKYDNTLNGSFFVYPSKNYLVHPEVISYIKKYNNESLYKRTTYLPG
ncbi:hypothetical protein EST35_0366 [Pseudomonas phage vB_PaeM_PA5oct]|uniref:Uncharacterized protein n=1 Tax=Pseudomonas phage vB_PaeM_PA5oct TaxID=2163605 RepID=A0A4Y5JU83_9CAUD|nr:hypothetical protein PQE65_gp119 [Pseudomonas phage vB_PaeM_PA5oct]QCG76246.1 hypothetical protein EST35_0366 [Pseudomonas phage vB_PaeM_PA5oct]